MNGFNKRKLFIIFSSVILIFCIITTTMFTSAKDMLVLNSSKNNNYVLLNNNLMLSDFSEKQLNLSGVSDNEINYSYNFNEAINGVTYSNTGFCIYNAEISNSNILYKFSIYKYNGEFYYDNKFSLNFELNNDNFAIDDNLTFYVANCNKDNKIYKISQNYRLNKTITADGIISQIFYFNGKVYAVCNNNIYAMENDGLKAIDTTDKITPPVNITGMNTLADGNGKVFTFQDNSFELVADFNNKSNLCLKTNKYFLSFKDNIAFGNEINNSDVCVEYTFSFDVVEAYYINSYIYAIGIEDDKYIVEKLQDSELNIVKNNNSEPTTLPTTQADFTTNSTEPSSTQKVTDTTEPATENSTSLITPSPTAKPSANTITSNDYTLSQDVISNIPSGTTVAKFKKNFDFDGDIIILDKNNNQKSSGAIGTGMKAVFTGDNTTTYTLCVLGDLTGEGNVNSLDVNKMFDFLLNIKEPTAVEFTAGDINQDGKLTNKDLLLLNQITVNYATN